jgi:methyl-accepting chemotaxis protein
MESQKELAMFKNMKLGTRITFGFGLLLAMLLVTGSLLAVSLKQTVARFEDTNGKEGLLVDLAMDTNISMLQCRRAEKDFIMRREQKYVDDFSATLAELTKLSGEMATAAVAAEMPQLATKAAEVTDAATAYGQAFRAMATALSSRDASENFATLVATDEAIKAPYDKMRATVHRIEPLVEECESEAAKQAESEMAAASAAAQKAIWFGVVLVLVSIVVGSVTALFVTRSTVGPLRRIITGLAAGSEQTAGAAGQVSSASVSLADGASRQAAAIEETSSSMEEMAAMTRTNAANAGKAHVLASQAKVAADRGVTAMHRMDTAIDDIKKSSDATARIIKTIDEIAFQTNLLALNAAVEAARAGEAGKGFAVVAEEVRNLAQRSAEAARNTADMIEESVKNAANGVAITREVGAALSEISSTAAEVNDLVAGITKASNEQAEGNAQINTAVGQMDQITQANAANAEQTASASEELSSQAEEMSAMVRELESMVGSANAHR